jgi:hypothetical protein
MWQHSQFLFTLIVVPEHICPYLEPDVYGRRTEILDDIFFFDLV